MVEVPPLVHVTGVTAIGEHSLRLLFEDGTVGDISFGDEEWTGVFEPLRNPARFAKVKVEGGTIVARNRSDRSGAEFIVSYRT